MIEREAYDIGKRRGAEFAASDLFENAEFRERALAGHARAIAEGAVGDRWCLEFSRGFMAAVEAARPEVSPQTRLEFVANAVPS